MDFKITTYSEEQTIELKTTNVAEITFPQRLSEKLEGNIIVQLQNANIQNITVDAKLNHAYSNKTIQLDLENNENGKIKIDKTSNTLLKQLSFLNKEINIIEIK